jgi:hypothetical protein
VEDTRIEAALAAAEDAVAAASSLSGTGFWPAVAAVKRQPVQVDRFGERIAVIDQAAFSNWALVKVPIGIGTAAMTAATVAGLALIWWAYYLTGFGASIAFLLGTGTLMVTTHGLAHLVIGRLMGIEFTAWFIGTWLQPQPGVKLDYETYLATPPAKRAWMHASGAITTKLLPFVLVGAAIASGAQGWVTVALLVVGVASIVTDVLWSTNASDWNRFRREMGFAQPSA